MSSLTRRGFLTGGLARERGRPAMPWAAPEDEFLARCTRCNACIDACPERIVIRGSGGFPEVDFTKGGCTFCGRCADACVPRALDRALGAPWALKATIGDACLARNRVVCRSCGERCEARAIRFVPALGGAADPVVDRSLCTGCGACVGVCPVSAIDVGA
jgi:ferredoxin-type protein NapF